MSCVADMARLMAAFKYAKEGWRKLRLVCNKTHLRIWKLFKDIYLFHWLEANYLCTHNIAETNIKEIALLYGDQCVNSLIPVFIHWQVKRWREYGTHQSEYITLELVTINKDLILILSLEIRQPTWLLLIGHSFFIFLFSSIMEARCKVSFSYMRMAYFIQ